jgi:hypothetical protein
MAEQEARRQAAQQAGSVPPDITPALECADGALKTLAVLPDLADGGAAVADSAGGVLEAIGAIFSGL